MNAALIAAVIISYSVVPVIDPPVAVRTTSEPIVLAVTVIRNVELSELNVPEVALSVASSVRVIDVTLTTLRFVRL